MDETHLTQGDYTATMLFAQDIAKFESSIVEDMKSSILDGQNISKLLDYDGISLSSSDMTEDNDSLNMSNSAASLPCDDNMNNMETVNRNNQTTDCDLVKEASENNGYGILGDWSRPHTSELPDGTFPQGIHSDIGSYINVGLVKDRDFGKSPTKASNPAPKGVLKRLWLLACSKSMQSVDKEFPLKGYSAVNPAYLIDRNATSPPNGLSTGNGPPPPRMGNLGMSTQVGQQRALHTNTNGHQKAAQRNGHQMAPVTRPGCQMTTIIEDQKKIPLSNNGQQVLPPARIVKNHRGMPVCGNISQQVAAPVTNGQQGSHVKSQANENGQQVAYLQNNEELMDDVGKQVSAAEENVAVKETNAPKVSSLEEVVMLHANGGISTFKNLTDTLKKVMLKPFKEGQFHVLQVVMSMGENHERFGFSLMGGVEEGFPARVDEITPGSPADEVDLKVGDEIMEVNGETLDGATHTEIIAHIHRCIKSRTIQLRVKRSTGDNKVPELNDIQDAYVVAVEEEAKKRLEQLSALHKVKAVDISKVHDFGNNLDNGSLNGNVETNPIYVATSKLTHKSTADDIITDRDNNSVPLTSPTSPSTIESDLTPGSVSIESNLGDADMEMYAMRNGGINGHSNGPVIQDAYASNGSLKDSNMAATQYGNHGNPYALQRSHEHLYESVEDDNEFDGPHREMAIDVPANFVGSKKQKPTFPSNGSRPVSKSQPSTPVKKPFEGDSADSMAKPPDMSHAEKLEHMERIKRYQEDLKKKREEEQRIANEEEFLRTSLRGSKKLQSLEESRLNQRQLQPIHPGFDNPNFEEEALGVDDNITHAATLPVRSHRAGGATKRPIAVEDLFSSLQHIQTKLRSAEDQQDVAFLNKLFHNSRFQQALHIHNKVVEVTMRGGKLPKPTCSNSQELCGDAMNSLNAIAGNPLGEELRVLLQGPNVKALMYSHDKVANQKSEPAKTTTDDDEREYLYERASQYNEDSIKIVRLQKTADPLGATVRNEGESVIVGRIVKGGAAEKSGLLHEGDEILEINGIDIRGKSVNDVCDLMANMTGTLTFLIVPGQDVRKSLLEEEEDADDGVVHLRAHFNYDPEEDIYIPCRELGISFQKGDVLHVINQEDANWWQAYREGEEDQALAGLIPSKSFQEQKEAMKQTIVGDKNESKKKSRCRCGTKSKSKKKKKQLYNASGEEADAEEILTYEEVALYYPQPNRKRPVVLIGPPNVGRHELRQRLMESDVDRFAAAVPHTSRVRKDDEVDLRDYYFVPRHQFEADIALQKFVEYGEYEKNLYGTSLEAIRQVVNSGKICILNLHPQSLRILKASDLKPYVVFVAPPNLENLRMIRHKQGAKISDNELQDIIEKAREMEDSYGHYFDYIIINFDLDKAYDELLSEINRLEVEPQWVPGHWVT